MAKIKRKYISFGLASIDVNAQAIPATHTAVNYTPSQVASEGTDKISAHLKGLDAAVKKPVYVSQATANTITTLTTASADVFFFTGSTAGTRINLGNATTYLVGESYTFVNKSSTLISLTDNSGTFLEFLYLGQQLQVILSDNSSANGVWEFQISNFSVTKTTLQLDDFYGATTAYSLNWAALTATGGTSVSQADEASRPGLHRLAITIANSSRSVLSNSSQIRNNNVVVVEGMVRPNSALSNNRIIFGLTTGTTVEAAPVACAYFYIDGGLSSWEARTANAATSTNVTTSVVFAPGTWYKLTIVMSGTRVDYYVNGILVVSTSTNVPANTNALIPTFGVIKTAAGGTLSTVDLDYYLRNFNITR